MKALLRLCEGSIKAAATLGSVAKFIAKAEKKRNADSKAFEYSLNTA
jgi:hypothetical protein